MFSFHFSNIFCFAQVQCYAMDTSIDPLNPVRWLEVCEGRLDIPKDSSAILTRIVKPFKVQMSDTHLLCMAQVSLHAFCFRGIQKSTAVAHIL